MIQLERAGDGFCGLGYFATRIEPYSKLIYRMMNSVIARMKWGGVAIPVNFGDLFTLYARKT